MEETQEEWRCPHCGRTEHDTMVSDHGTVEIDVTCKSVYITRDDGLGVAFSHKDFEKIIEHYEESELIST